ncbi:autotransporter outer membrane beta-barrel domain-containing protein [Pseudomonas sp. JDS28PS106]|uniref:autotransporter family protein n=1 Tax=Pseudomonas sp. JDS28PS106 TaxID=2497235 RepID=UPI002FD70267
MTDLTGDNALVFPSGGSGSITGNVGFGPGQDLVDMASGVITGNVTQGDGADRFVISGGSITGDVSQGSGIDTFEMTGGSLRSLFQGDGLDRFNMTAGTISNAFEDGDNATMSGGTIGRVDMKLDDNFFDLSGGRIVGNLVTGFGRDTIIVRGGSIGGAISVSGGDDQVTLTGGDIGGEIRTSFGNDRFVWRDGGTVRGAVLLADGNDSALLENLDETLLAPAPSIDAGTGVDRLDLSATESAGPQRYLNWEQINLGNGSRLDLAAPLVLGDAASGTGTLQIDATSRVSSTTGSVVPFLATQRVSVRNAGTLDLTSSGAVAGDTLRIDGDYTGDNGRLLLQSVLGDDNSATDRLIVAGGTISGRTELNVSNLDGTGASTRLNGIEVVQALEGATSDSTAFSLGSPLSAGAFQYYLFKGGVTAGSENSWFLRSSVVSPRSAPLPAEPPVPPPVPPVSGPDPVPPTAPTPQPTPEVPQPEPAALLPVPAPGTPALPGAAFDAEPIALYRLEVPVWSAIPSATATLALASIGTFHERQGEQSLLSETGPVPAGWVRLLGNDFRQTESGTVSPTLDATVEGWQVGHDLYAWRSDTGNLHRVGLFAGHGRLKGHVNGFAEGFEDRRSGKLDIDSDSLGAYWTLVGQRGWYLDAVLMGSRLTGDARSGRGAGIDTEGDALSASLEAGYPLRISDQWVAEPQVQFIHQRTDLDSQNDGISHVSFDAQPRNTGRIGTRFKGRYPLQGAVLEPYLRANIWHTFGSDDQIEFDPVDRIETGHASTRADLGAGLAARLSREVSLYVNGDYSQNLDANDYRGLRGSVGVRVSW